jgi:cps2I
MKRLLTVIIPVHNAAAFLERGVESVAQQSFAVSHPNLWEMILVNDGSTDNSGELCDYYAAKYPNSVRVVHQKNSGVGRARNVGLELAQGEYVNFLDADDFYDEGYLVDFSDIVLREQVDLVVQGYHNFPKDDPEHRHFLKSGFHYQKQLGQFYCDLKMNYLFFTPVAKFFKRSILHNHHIKFVEGLHYFEDYLFNLEFMGYVKSAATIDVPYYNYVQHEGERLGHKYTEPSVIADIAKRIFEQSQLLPYKSPEQYELDCKEYYSALLHAISQCIKARGSFKEAYRYACFLFENIRSYGNRTAFVATDFRLRLLMLGNSPLWLTLLMFLRSKK